MYLIFLLMLTTNTANSSLILQLVKIRVYKPEKQTYLLKIVVNLNGLEDISRKFNYCK